MSMQDVYDWIDANADECVRDLQRFVQQPARLRVLCSAGSCFFCLSRLVDRRPKRDVVPQKVLCVLRELATAYIY